MPHPVDQKDHPETGRQTEAWFRSLLDTALDGIIVTDERGRILTFNKACESMFGYSAAEMLGKTIDKVMPRGEATHHGDHIDRYIRTGEKRIIGIGRELSARHRDGSEFPIELSIGETRTVSGRQFIGIIRDISTRKETEARLRQLQAEHEHLARISAMNELGAAIAHELNQPLTANLLYVQAAIRQLEKAGIRNSTIVDSLEKAACEAERAGKIMRRMRRFVEKREIKQQRIEILSVLDEA
ncbi:MAG TPA: PAS domain-containing sensor histidine kinase, partial [Rhodobacteraceae bacterium]|nr:PAS domain-containing sensor histidine kinase [Paracoccaceae bacterium]